jgi:hypothetical protein
MTAGEVEARMEPFVRTLRRALPGTLSVLAEDRTYANAALIASHRVQNAAGRAALRRAYDRLVGGGVGA